MKKPNAFVEVFLSLIKWFLVILVVNNLIRAGVFIVATSSEESTETNNELYQDGYNNHQEINNGTKN
jgi:hypothetical protein